MFNKIYSKILNFIKENFFLMLPGIVIPLSLMIPIPYYISAPGGVINLDNKIKITNAYDSKGSLNLTYVSSYEGNITTYLLSLFNKGWDLQPKSDYVSSNEDNEDLKIRNKLYLENSLSNAYYVAYSKLERKIDISSSSIYAIYINENADTNIKVGDKILKIDSQDINTLSDITNYISTKNIGDKLKVTVNDGEEKYIRIMNLDGNKSLLISAVCNYDYNSEINFNFLNKESGPSGGLMIALSIYDKNTEKDLTNGLKIAGTGTIDVDGNVGEISGIKQKIMGAINENIDVFFVPEGNYIEAKEVVKENNYNINLVCVKTFDDALEYLTK